ncbi:unnamed protein product [Effrenium voratum]|uniref:Endonuclease/exonuclease/phosphatase domain-containing protein n=1 Tax=Effrenium voratum TaxID=2562239 RepID=A0AA36MMU4_9DINO|nr:unnamed protein product [Effrenium voratum]CAJ1422887.1 unnamed protein product [Effrenium voratum]
MATTAAADVNTALAIVPPEDVLQEVQLIRQQHDRAFSRWPPHVRLMWPFLPLRIALARLSRLDRLDVDSFDLELPQVELLAGGGKGERDRAYVGLTPSAASSDHLKAIWEALGEIFPECAECAEFHLTLGQLPSQEAATLVGALGSLRLSWRCSAVAVLACEGSGAPMRPVQWIALRERPPSSFGASLPLPSLAWRSLVEALPLQDAAKVARITRHQDVPGKAEWWCDLARAHFSTDSAHPLPAHAAGFSSLVGAAGYMASLCWTTLPDKAPSLSLCPGAEAMRRTSSSNVQTLPVPFGGAVRCVRHNSERLLVAGDASAKETGLALWSLGDLKEKPRFSKLRGHVRGVDLWEELLLVQAKGGSLLVHDLADPRAQPSALGKKEDGHVRDAQWMPGGSARALAAYESRVAILDVEAGGVDYLPLPLRSPSVCSVEAQVAVATSSACCLWDVRRSAVALEVPLSFSGACLAFARGSGLVVGGSGGLQLVDLRMGTTRPLAPVQLPASLREGNAEVQRLLTGHGCVTAQFEKALATWHLETGALLGWWEASRCLSVPTGAAEAAAAPWGLAAAGAGRLHVAMPGKPGPGAGKKFAAPKREAAKKATQAAPAPAQEPSRKLRTSEDVYHRILHDSVRFSPEEVAIGYEDRFLGPMEVKLLDFTPGGDIPFHRLFYFRRGEEILWDRKHRRDRVFGECAEAEADAPETVEAVRRAKVTAWKIEQGIIKVRGSGRGRRKATVAVDEAAGLRYSKDEGCWTCCPASSPARAKLRVLTLNVLFELYGDVETHMEARMSQMFQDLAAAELDVIALQEVTPFFAQALLAEVWVREGYWSSCGDDMASVDPSGQLILSRLPMRSVALARVSQHKSLVLATLATGSSRSAVVANLHLSADSKDARKDHRAEQLRACEAALGERLRPGDLGLLVGDFNASPEEEPPLLQLGLRDVWETNEEPGYTFDPLTNTVARRVVEAVGGSKTPRRLDRVYATPPTMAGTAGTAAWLWGTKPFSLETLEKEDWFISDHFGVLCEIEAADTEEHSGDLALAKLTPCEEILAPEILAALSLGESQAVELVLLGSTALGIADAGSDVDVLAACAGMSSAAYFAAAAAALQATGTAVEAAADAAVPLLRFQASGREVELQFVELPAPQLAHLRADAEDAYESLEALLFAGEAHGLSAALDAWALLRRVAQSGGAEGLGAFRGLAVAVKTWARRRQLLGTPWGFPGGFAWAQLAANEVERSFARLRESEDPARSLQESFFQHLATSQDLQGEPPKLWCPAGPQDRNALRTMTRTTARILQAQLTLAARGEADDGVFASPRFLLVGLGGGSECKPLLRRKAVTILLEVERCSQGTVWPLTDVHTTRGGAPCIVLGTGWAPTPGEVRALAQSLRALVAVSGLEIEVKVIPADSLSSEVPSCQPE